MIHSAFLTLPSLNSPPFALPIAWAARDRTLLQNTSVLNSGLRSARSSVAMTRSAGDLCSRAIDGCRIYEHLLDPRCPRHRERRGGARRSNARSRSAGGRWSGQHPHDHAARLHRRRDEVRDQQRPADHQHERNAETSAPPHAAYARSVPRHTRASPTSSKPPL
jgi:hypothetical protein